MGYFSKSKPVIHVKRKDIKRIKGRKRTLVHSLSRQAHEEHDAYYQRNKKFRDEKTTNRTGSRFRVIGQHTVDADDAEKTKNYYKKKEESAERYRATHDDEDNLIGKKRQTKLNWDDNVVP